MVTKQSRYRIWKGENGGYFLQRKQFFGWDTEIFDLGENSDGIAESENIVIQKMIMKMKAKIEQKKNSGVIWEGLL